MQCSTCATSNSGSAGPGVPDTSSAWCQDLPISRASLFTLLTSLSLLSWYIQQMQRSVIDPALPAIVLEAREGQVYTFSCHQQPTRIHA